MLALISTAFSAVILFVTTVYLFVWVTFTVSPFYKIDPSEVTGPPGRIIRSERVSGAPAGASAYRILYASTDRKGEPVAVSGLLFIPPGPAPVGGRPIYAWAHPTTGISDWCAPSVNPNEFQRIHGLKEFLDMGMVVVASDFQGLGTPGPHPYLAGNSEGRSILDSVRAARQFEGTETGERYGVWGYSQGAQGALFATLMARTYAPELELVGVAATAPPTRLHQLFQDNLDRLSRPHPSLSKGVTPLLMKLYDETQEKVISAYILAAWSEVYGTPFDSVLAPPAGSVVERVAKRCAEDSLGSLMITLTSQLANDDFLKELDLSKKPWPEYLARNSPSPKLPNVPLYILQGTADQTVDPSVSAEYAKMACANSVPVRFSWLVGVSHEGAGFFSTDDVVDWMTDRFAGKPPSDMCGRLPPLPDPPPPDTPIAGRTG